MVQGYAVDLIEHKDRDGADVDAICPKLVAVELDREKNIEQAVKQNIDGGKCFCVRRYVLQCAR